MKHENRSLLFLPFPPSELGIKSKLLPLLLLCSLGEGKGKQREKRERDFLLGMWGKGRRSTFRLEKEGKGGKCVLHFLPYSEKGKGFLECSEVGKKKFTEFRHKLSLKDTIFVQSLYCIGFGSSKNCRKSVQNGKFLFFLHWIFSSSQLSSSSSSSFSSSHNDFAVA